MCDLEREIRFILSGYVLLGQGASFASGVAPLFYCLRLGVMLVREHGVEIEIVPGSLKLVNETGARDRIAVR